MVYDCPGAQLAAKYGTSRYSSRCYLNLRSHPSGQKRPFQVATRTDFEPKVPYILSWPEAVLLVARYSILAFIVSLNTFNFNCFVMPLGDFASLLNCSITKHFFKFKKWQVFGKKMLLKKYFDLSGVKQLVSSGCYKTGKERTNTRWQNQHWNPNNWSSIFLELEEGSRRRRRRRRSRKWWWWWWNVRNQEQRFSINRFKFLG